MLSVENLSISFRTDEGILKATRDVSFRLQRGSTLAIVGESGSGKSVTTKAIMGLLGGNSIIESGRIIFDGKDLLTLSDGQMCKIRGRRIAMVFQDPFSSLNPIMKIGRQIVEAIPKESGMSRKEKRYRAISLMREVGIEDAERRFDQYPFEFSGGMRQRIVIAIALAADPDVLLCDEPTTALDVTIQAQILELLDGLKRKRSLSVIFITHDLGVVSQIADNVAVMYAGRIVESGTVREVFYEPRHPYTWALLSSMPDLCTDEKLESIPGSVPNMTKKIVGDAFAPRNKYALNIDFEFEPPVFHISPTHSVSSWLMDERAPKVQMPESLRKRIVRGEKNG